MSTFVSHCLASRTASVSILPWCIWDGHGSPLVAELVSSTLPNPSLPEARLLWPRHVENRYLATVLPQKTGQLDICFAWHYARSIDIPTELQSAVTLLGTSCCSTATYWTSPWWLWRSMLTGFWECCKYLGFLFLFRDLLISLPRPMKLTGWPSQTKPTQTWTNKSYRSWPLLKFHLKTCFRIIRILFLFNLRPQFPETLQAKCRWFSS